MCACVACLCVRMHARAYVAIGVCMVCATLVLCGTNAHDGRAHARYTQVARTAQGQATITEYAYEHPPAHLKIPHETRC
jgi:hypothetical protein